MILHSKVTVCVCMLAHNEEKNIENTLQSICIAEEMNNIPIYVYANGCTDKTEEVVTNFTQLHNNVNLCSLSIASKANAWNVAFSEQNTDFIVFSDGDTVVAPGVAMQLVNELGSVPDAIIATCQQEIMDVDLSFQQKLVGFMQIPLAQDFLVGRFYVVRRQALLELLEQKGFTGLPPGVVGEDAFLDFLVGQERLFVSNTCAGYVPPNFNDYSCYFARIRWQNEQIRHYWQNLTPKCSSWKKFSKKLMHIRSVRYFLVATLAVTLRSVFKMVFSSQIDNHYINLGQLRKNGAEVLSSATRSLSTK